jgi:serine/threonine-protein kinase HipA
MVELAEIWIWEEYAGAVLWNEQNQLASFEFQQDFHKKGWDLSPIKMPIANSGEIFSFPELRKGRTGEYDTFKGLPGLLADALPDRYGNQLINLWLEQLGRAPNSMNPAEQLCFIGSRGMGAMEFVPSHAQTSKRPFPIEISSLVDAAAEMLNRRSKPIGNLNIEEQKALTEILKIGTSAGGARPKAVISFNPITGEVKSGQGPNLKGFEHWLIKLDGVSDAQFGESQGWGRVEYAYHLMAKACDIDMMECRLLEEGKRAHFMTKRFDRGEKNEKHHVQTLCGIQHFDYNDMFAFSYEQVFLTMRMLRLTYPEAEEMFRRMVFNILATNCDDHTKNFSFILKKDQPWRLAPAYDMCYAYDPTNLWVRQQTLSVNGKRENITKEDLMTIAKANSIKKGEQIIAEINAVVKNWAIFAKRTVLNSEMTSRIQANLHTL